MYEVINYFVDLQDSNHPYSVGETFPRSGFVVSEERLKELAGTNNKRGIVLIKFKEDYGNRNEEFTKTQISRMAVSELRDLAAKCDIADASTLTGGVLKKLLIEHLKL